MFVLDTSVKLKGRTSVHVGGLLSFIVHLCSNEQHSWVGKVGKEGPTQYQPHPLFNLLQEEERP
eukprot:scaffold252779_cov19-Tisochrysis_lutea.AAC.1